MSPSLLHRFASTVVIALDVTVLRVGWVPPTHVLAHLSRPRRWVDAVGADGAALELARAGLWLAAVWLAVAVLAVLASIRPGTLGRVGDGVAARVVPALLRRIITAALGASVVLVPVAAGANTTAARSGTVAAVPVAVSSAPSPATATATELSGGWPWPTSAPTTPPTPVPTTSVPASAAPSSPVPWPRSAAPNRSAPGPGANDVVVEAGDCLWAIAAHRLGPHADVHRVATETRRWYAANATTIGPDPGLIHPGQRLHQPTEKGR